MPAPKPRPIVGRLADDEVNLVRNTSASGWVEKRSKLVCVLLLEGFKRKEIHGMALPDLRLHLRVIRVGQGFVPISEHLVGVIEEWLAVRPSRSDNLRLITGRYGLPCDWAKLDESRRLWGHKTVGRPVTCNEFLAVKVREVRLAYPHLTVQEVGKLLRISRNKAKWLLGMNTKSVVNKY